MTKKLVWRPGITPRASGFAKSKNSSLTPLAVVLIAVAVLCGAAAISALPCWRGNASVATAQAAFQPAVVEVETAPAVPEAEVVQDPAPASLHVEPAPEPAVVRETLEQWLSRELVALDMEGENATALASALRDNGCQTREQLALLLAIRKHENGGAGFEWGVVRARGQSYRKQAGWAMATILKYVSRNGHATINSSVINEFAHYYCPVDRTAIWKRNVNHWYRKILPVLRD